jgi:hypothetical protein
MFIGAAHRELAAALLAEEAAGAGEPGRLRERLRSEAAISLLSRFLIAEPPAGDRRRAAEDCAQRLRKFRLQEQVDALRGAVEQAERAGDGARLGTLTAELQEAYRELKGSAQAT